ncbi:MAG TPA: hypothetical protein PKJ99_02690 [Thermoanaerobaculales bacterium]|nr:hypothetical protein [Thermoanaerobaculales bacterium]HPA82431.1 hypothetical protein [Thermoanaerobaculales bacterium]HQL31038.1 hypothetical protein [Thermoanaerobaculales bacterium]HQN95480.1 hypothetical protein [Thermoanaerobaculales bacterium]HQP42191.1 hypothetical protein [Thermoanaerobaculales bacterium]
MMRLVRVLELMFMVALCLPPAVGAAETSGSLTVGGDTVKPTAAVAMWAESTAMWNKGAKILQIYMAPSPISTEGLDQALDQDESLRDGFPGDFVVLTLDDQGAFSMIYAYIDEGSQNYGFNEGVVTLDKLGPDVVSGRVDSEGKKSLGDTPISFDLRFEAAILPPPPKGTDLGTSGGAPGAAYLAYVTALREGDAAMLLKHAAKAHADEIAATPEEYRQYTLDSAKESAPLEMAVTGGQLFGGYAILTVAGKDWAGDKVEGKVKMVLDGEIWRFAEEDLETVW